MAKKGRVFSGMRPTGRLHIGNYLGALKNWVDLQQDYDCVYSAVDIHALTTLEDVDDLQDNIQEMVLDFLAAGIDPQHSILYAQSQVPEVMELATLLGMITPLGWLTRVASFKEKVRQQPENVNYGLVGYPVLMTADIILYKADTVPVGRGSASSPGAGARDRAAVQPHFRRYLPGAAGQAHPGTPYHGAGSGE